MSVLVFVSRDFELGRTWLAGGVNLQSRTGLIFLILHFMIVFSPYIVRCLWTEVEGHRSKSRWQNYAYCR